MRLGLLNMMPDPALRVTERQFARLCGRDGPDDLVLFGVAGVSRGPTVAAHVAERYRDAAAIPTADLDVLVISGTNVGDPHLPGQPFWRGLREVFAHVSATGLPTLFSCLATHAFLLAEHGQERRPVVPKVWGVFPHDLPRPGHPLVAGLDAPVPVPHSRHNHLDAAQFAAAGLTVLLDSPAVGPHLAVAADGRRLFLQGHPEYEAVSLLKEYKREVGRWQGGERPDFPPLPAGYLDGPATTLLAAHAAACRAGPPGPPLPEAAVTAGLAAPWAASARRIVGRWLASLT
ncbi:homoserine O-succinyltransferase [bacterium]|nr:homoserine O-succinyltransferase [bacterium]